ncbi:DUF4268 domain-containing protein [Vampirovibrio sp.]|uniref:DUF4268 domain-containing protein n=1 Tax=Vampirovibrio sp. TaxID=2717857 RepID=UPI003592F550
MNISLGRLEKVDLRHIWENEATAFTPWLAREENLALLSEAVGLELELEAQEKSVGPFSADLLCKDLDTDNWVLIENQLERTDHKHLGQLLTYAAGLKAVSIVWIAQRFTEEHRSALDWLNEITDERFNFFGLEVELWRIGDSPVAPKFNVISKPNDWTKRVVQGAKHLEQEALTETKQLQQKFWMELKDWIDGHNAPFRMMKPSAQHWTSVSLGKSGFKLSLILNTRLNEIRVELCITHPQGKAYFKALEEQKAFVERELEQALAWRLLEEKKTSIVELSRSGFDLQDFSQWPSMKDWFLEYTSKMYAVFAPRIKLLDPTPWLESSVSDEEPEHELY